MQRMRTDGTGRQRRAVSSTVVAATIAIVAVGMAVFIAILAAMGTDLEYTGTAKSGTLETAETTQSTTQMPIAGTGASTSLAAIESNAKACAEGPGRSECIAIAWSAIAGSDPQAALDGYARHVKGDGALLQQCHGAHHIIGSAAGAENEIARIIETNPGTCGLGYIHGAIGAYLSRQAAGGNLRTDGAAACEQLRTDEALYENCQHALGHEHVRSGERDIVAACGTGRGSDSCLSGAYMEQVAQIETGAEFDAWLDRCPKTANAAEACWSVLSANSEAVLAYGSDTTIRRCVTSGAETTCLRAVGEAVALEIIERGTGLYDELTRACAAAGKKSGACLAGGGVIIHGAGVQGILEPSEIERSFNTDLPAQWRDAVREAIEAVEYLPGGGA